MGRSVGSVGGRSLSARRKATCIRSGPRGFDVVGERGGDELGAARFDHAVDGEGWHHEAEAAGEDVDAAPDADGGAMIAA
jgi:hypothetical protein